MPTNYQIPNVYEAREGCPQCGGTGMIATYVGTTTCPLCRDWLRNEQGKIASSRRESTGETPAFRHEMMTTTHGQIPAQRNFADGATAAVPRIVKAGSPAARAARRR